MKLNERQETVKYKIMMNPLNRMLIYNEAEELYTTKIKEQLEHNGEPLLGVIKKLIMETGKELSVEEYVNLQVVMYMIALDGLKESA